MDSAPNSYRHREDTPLHIALIAPTLLGKLPAWLIALIAILPLGILIPIWREYAFPLIGFHLIILLADWLSLYLLPRTHRSFGPVEAPLVMLTVFRVMVSAVPRLSGATPLIIWMIVITQLVILAVTFYGQWIEPFRLSVTTERLVSPKLDPALPPIRILHLADLHVERIGKREAQLQQLIEEANPDVIVFSGDFVNLSYRDDQQAWDAVRRVISQWRAPFGTFVVSGSPLVESQDMVDYFTDGLGLRWLRNEIETLAIRGQQITLIGVTCHHEIEADGDTLRQTVSQVQRGEFQLLLYHSPDLAEIASQAGVDLYVCGHTHGGQLRLPIYGAIITSSSFGKRFEMGRYLLDQMTLYTSRGIGMEGGAAPRARLFCPPEIILWSIEGEAAH